VSTSFLHLLTLQIRREEPFVKMGDWIDSLHGYGFVTESLYQAFNEITESLAYGNLKVSPPYVKDAVLIQIYEGVYRTE
jgi:hypothetical protein